VRGREGAEKAGTEREREKDHGGKERGGDREREGDHRGRGRDRDRDREREIIDHVCSSLREGRREEE